MFDNSSRKKRSLVILYFHTPTSRIERASNFVERNRQGSNFVERASDMAAKIGVLPGPGGPPRLHVAHIIY